MKVSIYNISETVFDDDAEKIIVSTSLGEITILDGHIPIISMIRGPAFSLVDKDGKTKIIKVSSGFIEVRPENHVVILAEV